MSNRGYRQIRAATIYGVQQQSPRMWRNLLKIMGDKCLRCGGKPVTRDHIVPLARGGLNHPSNLQPLCTKCNNKKGDAIMDYRSAEQRAAILERWPLKGPGFNTIAEGKKNDCSV